jgi:uncharacterized membrane protein
MCLFNSFNSSSSVHSTYSPLTVWEPEAVFSALIFSLEEFLKYFSCTETPLPMRMLGGHIKWIAGIIVQLLLNICQEKLGTFKEMLYISVCHLTFQEGYLEFLAVFEIITLLQNLPGIPWYN